MLVMIAALVHLVVFAELPLLGLFVPRHAPVVLVRVTILAGRLLIGRTLCARSTSITLSLLLLLLGLLLALFCLLQALLLFFRQVLQSLVRTLQRVVCLLKLLVPIYAKLKSVRKNHNTKQSK